MACLTPHRNCVVAVLQSVYIGSMSLEFTENNDFRSYLHLGETPGMFCMPQEPAASLNTYSVSLCIT